MNILWQVIFIFLTPLIGSALLYFFLRRAGAAVNGVITLIACLISLVLASLLAVYPAAGKSINILMPWISFLGVNMSLYYDGLAALVLITSTAVASLAVLYSIGYFKDQAGFDSAGFYSLVLLFMAGLIGVVLSSNLIMFYVFWEMMLLPSYGMVAFFGEDRKRSPLIALKYFIYTHIGAVMILFAILLIFSQTGSTEMLSLKAMLMKIDPLVVKSAALLFILGFAVKMAIFPFHSWLPETYANAPIPATILLSAVMMNAPIYGFLRFFFTLLPRDSVQPFVLLILVLAVISQFYGAVLAYAENNIKRMVAYSSVSQMGYVLFGIGALTFLGVSGSAFHIVNHSIIKALLFMSVGAVFLATKTYDTKKLGGLTSKLPLVALAGTAGALAIAGVPLFSAFQSEWLIFAGGLKSSYPLLGAIAVLGVVFTAGYALRFVAEIFFGDKEAAVQVKVPATLVISMVSLSLITLIIGIYPWFVSGFVRIAVKMLGV